MREGLGQPMETKADTNSLPSNSEDLLAKALLILRKPEPPPAPPLFATSESSFSVNFSPPPGTENVADAGIIMPRDPELSPPAPEERSTMWVVTDDYDPNNDGYGWQKYGEYHFFGEKYPRQYYRCLRSESRGCLATKGVRRVIDVPSVFEIVCAWSHACIDPSDSSRLEQPLFPITPGKHYPADSTDLSTGHSGTNFASGMPRPHRPIREFSGSLPSVHQPASSSPSSVQDSCSTE